MDSPRAQMELLADAGRLLLENGESTGAIHCALERTARTLTNEPCDVAVAYRRVAVSLAGNSPIFMPVRNLRFHTAVLARVHSILQRVRCGELEPVAAQAQLRSAETEALQHARLPAVLLLAIAAAALARLLGADTGAVLVAGAATALGLVVRQELGRRHFNSLMLPLAAAFVGAVVGGIAIRFQWTQSPGLALIVPALMLVPGPHLINGLLDLIDNYLPMSIARLGLATAILLASALGVLLGIELTIPEPLAAGQSGPANVLNVLSDMILAGIVTCGFATYYNTPWAQVGMAVLGGMAGHGLRFIALQAGWTVEAATLVGGLAVGLVSASIARSNRTPVAVIAFAGAVTMMPGLQIYRALSGALQMARLKGTTDLPTVAGALGDASQAFLAVAALALGLIAGSKVFQAIAGEREAATASAAGSHSGEAPDTEGGQHCLPAGLATFPADSAENDNG
ncbi:MAG TPA: threonine/serine exporter family protein [Gemmataceae bacterium]|jgi:uncharacterized membrane protein YjjP (DUF1212 family)|nr:threonine/serine exporter family protein [Gemmataceae bacterium]